MKNQLILAVMLIVATLTAAQSTTAPQGGAVVPMSPRDAQAVRDNWDRLQAAQKQWEATMKEVGRKYLIVERTDPNAGTQRWYPDSDSDTGLTIGTASSLSGAVFFAADGTWSNTPEACLTPAERAKLNAQADAEKKRRDDAEAAREAKSKRVRKGFSDPDNFVFSDDWGYLLPKPVTLTPSPMSPWVIPTWGSGTFRSNNSIGVVD